MIKYFIKYYIYNGNTKFLKSSFILPLLTVVVGCFVMMMSFSIMEGFSNKISDTIYFFDKEQSITINKKEFLSYYNKEDLDSLINFLINRDYFFNSYEDRVMFVNNSNYKTIARVYGIINFNDFIPNQASTIEGVQTIVNAVLAGPLTLPGTITVTGTVVIV